MESSIITQGVRNKAMNLLSLRYFCEAAKCGKVTLAAERLHVSQPAVSKTLRSLEEELSCELFYSTPQGIRLTEAGERFQKKISSALELIDDAVNELQSEASESQKTLRIVSFLRFAFLPDIYLGFQKKYPSISLEIKHAAFGAALRDADYDIAILPENCLSSTQDSICLLKDELMLAVPSGHPLSGRDEIDLKEAESYPFVVMGSNAPARIYLESACAEAGFRPDIAVECDDTATYYKFLRAGYGISMISSHNEVKDTSDLSLISIRSPRCSRSIYLAWPKGERASKKRNHFINFCKDYAKDLK